MAGGVWSRVAEEIGYRRQPRWPVAAVGEYWDRVEQYDDVNRETYAYARRFADGLRISDIPDGARVLDFCARTGNGTLHFFRHGKVGSVVCADVSPRMGEICRRRLSDAGVRNFTWVRITDYALPFPDGEFDAVLCFETVEHFSEPERLLRELGRVTRSQGSMVLTTPNVLWEPVHALAAITGIHHSEGPHRFIRWRRLLRMLEASGFRVARAETTVLIPAGPAPLIRLGEWLERRARRVLMPWVGLRRVLLCHRM